MGKRKLANIAPLPTGPAPEPLDPLTGMPLGQAPSAPRAAPEAPTAEMPTLSAGGHGEAAGAEQSVTAYDAEGNPVAVGAGDFGKRFLAGELFVQKGQKVNVKDTQGRILALDADKAAQAFRSGLATRAATDEDIAAAKERAEQNTIGKTIEAGAIGVGRGLTLGLSDPLVIGGTKLLVGDEAGHAVREHLEKLEEHHGIASKVGEFAGAILPVALSAGGGSAVEGANVARGAAEAGRLGAKAAGAIKTAGIMPRLVAGAGEAVEHRVAHMMGRGAESLLGKVAQKAIPMAAQGAVEGGLYGVGAEISEASLGDHDLTAEKLVAAFKHGAGLGMVTGGVLGTGEVLGREAVNKGLKLMGKESVEDFFRGFANERTFKAIGGDARTARRMGEKRMGEISERILNEHLDDGTRLFKPGASVEELGERIGQRVEEVNAKLTSVRREISEAAGAKGVRPDIDEFLATAEKDVVGSLRNSDVAAIRSKATEIDNQLSRLRLKNEANKIASDPEMLAALSTDKAAIARLKNPYLSDALAGKDLNTIDDVLKFRKDLDTYLFPKPTAGGPAFVSPAKEELLRIRGILDDHIDKAAEAAATAIGKPELVQQLTATKATLHDLIPAKQMAAKWDMSKVGNRVLSLSDNLMAGAAGGGALARGDVLGALGAVPGGVAAGFAHKVIRERSSSVLAEAADRLAKLSAVQRAASKVDAQIAAGVKDLLGHGGRETLHAATVRGGMLAEGGAHMAPAAGKAAGKAAEYERTNKALAEHGANAGAHVQQIAKAVEPFAAHAPNIATKVSEKATTVANNLSMNVAGPRIKPNALQPHLDPPKLSNSEMGRRMQYANAANKPLSVLKDALSEHRVPTHTEMKAVQDNFPGLVDLTRQTLIKALVDHKEPLTYQQRLVASRILGVPADPSQEPQFRAAVQQMYAQTTQAQGQGQSGKRSSGPKRPLKTAETHMTATERLAAPGD